MTDSARMVFRTLTVVGPMTRPLLGKHLAMSKPTMEYDYEMYMLEDPSAVRGVKRKFDVNDPKNDDDNLYTFTDDQGLRAFKFKRVRAYETYQQQADGDDACGDSVALALHDFSSGNKRLPKGAYFYPIVQRTGVRPKRNVGKMLYQMEEQKIDELNVTVADMNEESRAEQLEKRAQLDPAVRTSEVAG